MALLIYLAFGIIFALLCASMAKSRNRSIGLWTVLGFFLGLFAVLILAIIGKDKNAPAAADPASAGTPALQPAKSSSNLDEIAKLKKLLDDGVLTQDEFDEQKRRLLQ
ncbi:SHOCT domain-containing protein [Pacificispira sp.]|uniref:SHOCT domain-containing protein n=1 Tax=Pacificispira sp. TaxID=2888761 RepID=UPI003BAAD9CE